MRSEVLGNDVRWRLDTENEENYIGTVEEDISYFISQGYSSGQLSVQDDDKEVSGWWEVIDWKSIACVLYHAVNSTDSENKTKALEKFDKAW